MFFLFMERENCIYDIYRSYKDISREAMRLEVLIIEDWSQTQNRLALNSAPYPLNQAAGRSYRIISDLENLFFESRTSGSKPASFEPSSLAS